ncbi:MAG: rRNA (uracil1939-C5)-methyltransferase [Candidatus Sumerlaeota bacterium]|nr:rRNA (uracil1939-C5)-methyltransferase [Candidatus Sumerlaeota bacterium]
MDTPRQAPSNRPVKRGDILEVDVDALVYGGRALARIDGYVVFIPHAAPGDRVRIRITKRKSGYAEGELLAVVEPAPERIAPPCSLFGACGGCTWQHLPIRLQEHWKERIITEALHPVRSLQDAPIEIEPIVPSPQPYHYRNKMEFTFGRATPDGPLKLGFHMPGNWKHILDVEKCWLQPGPLDALLAAAREEGMRQWLSAWNPMRHEGILRHLVIRWSEHEQAALVAILTGKRTGFDFEAFRKAIVAACPQIKGVMWGLNSGKSDVARAEEVLGNWGEQIIEERLGDLRFQISLQSFFQTNTKGAQLLYQTASDFLDLTGNERLFDAYCGTGTIGIFCAHQAKEVYGIELLREAVWDARKNAEANGLTNCTFMAGDMAAALPNLLKGIPGQFDRLVVDPPRGGMDKKALSQLLDLRAPVMVYVSCNPTTMARDLQIAVEAGYRVDRVRAVDMFPQTYHIECVTRCVLES